MSEPSSTPLSPTHSSTHSNTLARQFSASSHLVTTLPSFTIDYKVASRDFSYLLENALFGDVVFCCCGCSCHSQPSSMSPMSSPDMVSFAEYKFARRLSLSSEINNTAAEGPTRSSSDLSLHTSGDLSGLQAELPSSSDWLSAHEPVGSCRCQPFPVHGHRAIISRHSEVFFKMFTIGMKEKCDGVVYLPNMSPVTLRAVLKYIYTGTLTVALDTIVDVYCALDQYQIDNSAHLNQLKHFARQFQSIQVSFPPKSSIKFLLPVYCHHYLCHIGMRVPMTRSLPCYVHS